MDENGGRQGFPAEAKESWEGIDGAWDAEPDESAEPDEGADHAGSAPRDQAPARKRRTRARGKGRSSPAAAAPEQPPAPQKTRRPPPPADSKARAMPQRRQLPPWLWPLMAGVVVAVGSALYLYLHGR